MARGNNKKNTKARVADESPALKPAVSETGPDLMTFDDAAEEPRVSAMEDFMDEFQGADDDSEDESQAQAANAEFDRVTRMGGLPPPESIKAALESTPEEGKSTAASSPGSGRTAHAGRSSYQSPYAMQTGEEDVLSGTGSKKNAAKSSSLRADKSAGRESLMSVRSAVEDSSLTEVHALIKKALQLYADDKIIMAGDLLLRKIDQTKLHETYCKENPKLAEMMNRYYVIWTARKTMDAINMRRYQESVEDAKAEEYNRVRKEIADQKWREESWFSPQAYSWFKEENEMESSPDRKTCIPATLEDQETSRATRVWGGADDDKNKHVRARLDSDSSPSSTLSEANRRQEAKTKQYPTKDNGARASETPREISMQEGTKYHHTVDTEKFSTWDLQKEHDGIRVAISPDLRYRDPTDESSRIYSSVVEGKVDIEFFPLLSMLNEVDLFPAWMEGSIGGKVVKCEVIERQSRSNFVVRMLFSMTWPLAWRKVVFRVMAFDCLNSEDQVKQMAIVLEDVSIKDERAILGKNPYWDVSHDKPYEGSIRARVQNSCVLVTPSGTPGETWIQSYCSIVPRMKSAPNWLVDSGYRNVAYNFIQMLRNAKKVTKQAIYRDRQMDPNNQFYSWIKKRTRAALPFERCPNAVSMAGISGEDVPLVRALVQKAVRINDEMTTTVEVNGTAVVVDKRVFAGGDNQQKNFGSASNASLQKKKDIYDDEEDDDCDDCTSSDDEGYGLLAGEEKKESSSPVRKGAGGLEDAPSAKMRSAEKAPEIQESEIGEEVRLLSNPDKVLNLGWAMEYVKLERRVTVLNVREGMKVRRGLHWKYGDEDLGVTPNGGYGTVIKYDVDSQIAKVRWHIPAGWVFSEQKKIGKYRLGPVFFDLAIYEDEVQAAVTEMLHNQMDPVREKEQPLHIDL